jgi:hypothetical protein
MTENIELIENSHKVHTTALGAERIKRNLCLNVDDVVFYITCQKYIFLILINNFLNNIKRPVMWVSKV